MASLGVVGFSVNVLHVSPHALEPRNRSRHKQVGSSSRDEAEGAPERAAAASAKIAALADFELPAVGWLWDRKPSVSRESLRQQNIKPKRSLGQNFMVDDQVLACITKAADISPGDPVLEVGPGTGALTRHLLRAGARVTAVEKDYGLHDRLAVEFSQVPAVQLVCGDILRQDLPALLDGMAAAGQRAPSPAVRQTTPPAAAQRAATPPPVPAGGSLVPPPLPLPKVVANLPYNITKDFLLQALPLGGRCGTLMLMLQDEVAVRLTACDPGGPEWRSMNIIVQYYSQPRYLVKIDRRKYVPVPQVHGAVVEFVLLPPERRVAVPSERGFLRLVKTAFLQRRKTLRNALQPLVSGAQAAVALAAAGIPEDARAQNLGLEDFVRLAWAIEEKQSAGSC